MNRILVYAVIGTLNTVANNVYGTDSLQEIIITSSRTAMDINQVGSAVTIIDRQQIQRRGYSSASELLRTQPGIAVSNQGGAGKTTSLRIRGEEGYRTLVMMDGVEVSDPSNTQVAPRMEHLGVGSEIERIEILRGPQGFIYGADAGGVINIITRTARTNSGGGRVESGSDASHLAQVYGSASNESLSAFVSFMDVASDGFNTLKSDITQDNDGYENTTVHGKFALQIDPQWRGQLVARQTQAQTQYDNCWFADDGGNYLLVNDCTSEFDQRIVKLSFDYQGQTIAHHWAVGTANVDTRRFARQQDSGLAKGTIKKMEYVGRFAVTPVLQLVGGLDYKNEAMLTNYVAEQDRRQMAVFTEAQIDLPHALHLSVGLRHDDHQTFGGHLSKRLSAAWIHTYADGDWLKLRSSWGTGFRAPSLYESFYNATSFAVLPPLKEELSEGGDLGVEWHSVKGAVCSVGVFDQSIRDEIEFDLVNYSGYLQQTGVSHSRGLELAAHYPLTSQVFVDGNYTYNRTMTADDQTRVRRPKHLANLALGATLWGTLWAEQVTLHLSVRTSRDAIDIDDKVLDDYSVVDFNGQYRLNNSLNLYLRINNLFDQDYEEARGYNVAGEQLALGIQAEF